MQFAWDPKKAASNVRDHRLTFEEASSVFGDHWRSHSTIPIIPKVKGVSSLSDCRSKAASLW